LALLGVPVAPRLLVVASGLVLLELAPAAAVSGRSMVLRILAVDAFISLMTAGDVVAFRINRRFLSVLSLPLVPYLPHLGDAISSAIHPGDALLLVALVVLALIAALLPRSEAFSGAGRLFRERIQPGGDRKYGRCRMALSVFVLSRRRGSGVHPLRLGQAKLPAVAASQERLRDPGVPRERPVGLQPGRHVRNGRVQ